jgi:hypothetical protein
MRGDNRETRGLETGIAGQIAGEGAPAAAATFGLFNSDSRIPVEQGMK